jgi:hypothetical protein
LLSKKRSTCRVLVGKPETKQQLGRPRHRRENNIIRSLVEVGWEGINCMNLADHTDSWQLVHTAVNLLAP